MKKVSSYVVVAVVAGILLAAFWAYQRYFRGNNVRETLFTAALQDMEELVKARGEVVAEKDFDLEFPVSGTVERIFVEDGAEVARGARLMKLDTNDLELNLQKLLAGVAREDVSVSEAKVAAAASALADAKRGLTDVIEDAYTKSDDAVRNNADKLFANPRTNPTLLFVLSDSQLAINLETTRKALEDTLTVWRKSLATPGDLLVSAAAADKNLGAIKSFLDDAAFAVNSLVASSQISQTTIDTYRTAVSAARTNVAAAIAAMTAAEEKLRTAEAQATLAEQELLRARAGAAAEESDIAIVRDKIRKSTLLAPAAGRVTKVWFELQEIARPGQVAVSIALSGYKAQADISELEIGKIRTADDNEVTVTLDAFPGRELRGKVISVDSKEVLKDGDKYYRVNVSLGGVEDLEMRTGMSADLVIHLSARTGVLAVPVIAVNARDGRKFVRVREEEGDRDREVVTGVSDGEFVEITSGLRTGETVVVGD